MPKETIQELKIELAIRDSEEKQRGISDNSYAKIIVQKIVFGGVKIILVAVLMALIGLVIKSQI